MSEILSSPQKIALKMIGKSQLNKYFYWTGGTALAFYLKHRRSEDLDFMSEELLPDEFLAREVPSIGSKLKTYRIEHIKQFNRWQYFLFFQKSKQLKLEFVYYPFPKLARRIKLKEYNLQIDSLKDIAVNKAYAIFERSEPKDVYDIYTILRKKEFTFSQILNGVHKKFGVDIDPIIFIAKVMAGIKRISKIKPLIIDSLPPIEFLNSYFQNIANQYLKKKLK